jgi:Meiotically up-regulated gene 113
MDRTDRNEDKPSRNESQQNPPSDSWQPRRDDNIYDTPKANGCVYFIRCGDFIKIGYSLSPERRLSHIMTVNPHEIELLGYRYGTRDDEALYHERFAPHRHRGEWFNAAPEIETYARTLMQSLPKKPPKVKRFRYRLARRLEGIEDLKRQLR